MPKHQGLRSLRLGPDSGDGSFGAPSSCRIQPLIHLAQRMKQVRINMLILVMSTSQPSATEDETGPDEHAYHDDGSDVATSPMDLANAWQCTVPCPRPSMES